MKSDKLSANDDPCIIAFFFDSGKIDDCFYGDIVFKNIIDGKEIANNSYKIVFSEGDIFDRNIYDDISPFIIRDKMCTIEKNKERYADVLFAFLLEDIEVKIAIDIDTRLKSNFSAYLGMTSIDIESSDTRKQFWKGLVRCFNIEGNIITVFGTEEDCFSYSETARSKGFHIHYDGLPDDFECENRNSLFSTRQSSFIKSIKQLEFLDGKNDSDRGILEMNYSLVKEVELAGVQVWKAIEDINYAYIPKESNKYITPDYIFTSLYQAAQGVERLLKVVIELIMYDNENDNEKQKINDLLYSHNHPAMYDFVSEKTDIILKPNCKKLLNILSSFYSKARYNRFRYNNNDILELKLLQDFGQNIKKDCFDEQLKHLYGKSLGQIVQTFYKLIETLSYELNIFVYELNSESVACFALKDYYGDDLYKTLKQIEQAKRELIWYLIKSGNELPASKIADELSPLSFEQSDITDFINNLITNENSCYKLYNFVSESYDEIIAQDKEKWKERIDAIDALVGNPNVFFDEDETGED